MLLVAYLTLATTAWACAGPMDCSLNGDCTNGACVCDVAWAGSPTCDTLSFAPTPVLQGYHNSTEASWGGNAVLGEDGKWHLFVAQILHAE